MDQHGSQNHLKKNETIDAFFPQHFCFVSIAISLPRILIHTHPTQFVSTLETQRQTRASGLTEEVVVLRFLWQGDPNVREIRGNLEKSEIWKTKKTKMQVRISARKPVSRGSPIELHGCSKPISETFDFFEFRPTRQKPKK